MAWVQDDTAIVDTGAFATTISKAFGANVTAGNLIAVWAGWDDVDSTPTCADTLGNTYTAFGKVWDATNAAGGCQFYAANIAGGANTVTVTFPVTADFRRLGIMELSGRATASPADVNAIQVQAAPGTGTDAHTSGNVTTTATDDLFGVHQDIAETDPSLGTVSAGTNYTAREKTGTDIGMMETRDDAASGTYAATFTRTNNVRAINSIMAFKQAAAGAAEFMAAARLASVQAGVTGRRYV